MNSKYYTVVTMNEDRHVLLWSTSREYIGFVERRDAGWTWTWFDIKHSQHYTNGDVMADFDAAVVELIEDYSSSEGIPLPPDWVPNVEQDQA